MKKALASMLVLLLLAGCEILPFARELESTMLVQVLGVDWGERGVTLTGAADTGGNTGGGSIPLLSASGGDLEEAKRALRSAGDESVSLTHVAQLVLGEQTDLTEVLEAALEEPSLGQGATVWLVKEGTAKDLMTAVKGGAKRLSSIELNSGADPVTVLQSLMRIKEFGQVELPVLDLEKDTLVTAGTKVVLEEVDEG